MQRLLVRHGRAALGDGADAELTLERRPHLAGDEDVQRRTDPACHLGAHGHAATRQGQDDGVGEVEPGDVVGEPAPGLGPVLERHASRLPHRHRHTRDGRRRWRASAIIGGE